MNALEKNIAVARGEALAANLLATAAIHAAISITAKREEVWPDYETALTAFMAEISTPKVKAKH